MAIYTSFVSATSPCHRQQLQSQADEHDAGCLVFTRAMCLSELHCMQALTSVIRNSTAQTMMGLEKELKDAAASLQG